MARDERPGDRELLLLAARERARVARAELPDDREELVDGLDVVVGPAPSRRAQSRA